ncbi:hypothetical protein BMS3Abin04_01209 [bacterium BMS3Abin04]|nr:hypothetical protein BMS3Abin04_01209 [bacterium BMS3Abin04]
MKRIFYSLIVAAFMIGCSKSGPGSTSEIKKDKTNIQKNEKEPKGYKSIQERDWEAHHKDSLKTKKKDEKKQQQVIRFK